MWQTDLVELLRVYLFDLDSTKYSDEVLERLLVAGAFSVLCEGLTFNFEFSADVGEQTISPDPTEPDSLDDSFSNLICMKAACIENRGAAAKAAGQSIAIKDGSSSVDLRGIFQGALEMLKNGYCVAYDEAKRNFQLNNISVAGAAVMGPFRLYAREVYGYNTYDGNWIQPANNYGSF